MAFRAERHYSGTYTISDAKDGPRDGTVTILATSFLMAWNHATMTVLREQNLSPEAVVDFSLTLAAE